MVQNNKKLKLKTETVVVYRIEREMTLGVAEISQRLLIGRLAWLLCKTYVLNKYGNSRNPLSYVCRKLSKRTVPESITVHLRTRRNARVSLYP